MSDQIINRICKNINCRRANQCLDISEFSKDSRRKDGIRVLCRECLNIRRAKNSSVPEQRTRINKRQSLYCQTANGRFSKYKDSAKTRNLIFSLSLENFKSITNKPCYYCEEYSEDKNFTGIDRINSNIGYILINCVPCCSICNYMKNDLEFELMFQRCRKIVNKEMNRRLLLQKQYDVDYDTYA